MRQILLLLISLLALNSIQAQISITKRKHRGGFHIETNFKRNKVAKLDKHQVKEASAPKAPSANYIQLTQKKVNGVQSEDAIEANLRLPNYMEQKPYVALKTTPKWLANKFTYLPSGAAWMKKITDPPKKEVKHIKAKNTFAIIGFALSISSLTVFITTLTTGYYFIGMAIFLAVLGFVFCILGTKSNQKRLAVIGRVLSLLAILSSLALKIYFDTMPFID